MDLKNTKIEVEELENTTFEKPEEHARFIRRVYTILTLMLLTDAGCVAAALYIPVINHFLTFTTTPLLVAACAFVVFYGVLALSDEVRRRAPFNYIMIAALTLSSGYVMGAAVADKAGGGAVMLALLGTSMLTLTVTVVVISCPCHFTNFTNFTVVLFAGGISVAVAATTFICVSSFTDLAYYGRLSHIGILVAFATLITFYLAYDTQMVLGGQCHHLKPDEYVHGALHLWVDIVVLFLSLFQLNLLSGRPQPVPLSAAGLASTSAAAAPSVVV